MAKCVKCKSDPIPAEQSDSCYKCLCRQQDEQITELVKDNESKNAKILEARELIRKQAEQIRQMKIAGKVISQRNAELQSDNKWLKREYAHKEKVIDDVWQKMHYLESREYQECKVFVDHVKNHLSPNQFVVCKICNKTINEIWQQALAAPPQKGDSDE